MTPINEVMLTEKKKHERTHSLATVMMQSDITFNLEYLISFLFSTSSAASLTGFFISFSGSVFDSCLGRFNELFAEKIEMFDGDYGCLCACLQND